MEASLNAILSGVDTAGSQSHRHQIREWRDEDVKWRSEVYEYKLAARRCARAFFRSGRGGSGGAARAPFFSVDARLARSKQQPFPSKQKALMHLSIFLKTPR